MSLFARIAVLSPLLLLGACQLPSLHEPKRPAARLSEASELAVDWEPALPGRDASRSEALAYAVREVLIGLTPEQRQPVLVELTPRPVSVERLEGEAEPVAPAPGLCGALDPLCAALPPTRDFVRLEDRSTTPPVLTVAAAAHARYLRWSPAAVAPSDVPPSVDVLATVLTELTGRLGTQELAVAALLLGPDVERRIAQSRKEPSLSRISGWLNSKRAPLVERTREALTLAELYSLTWPVPRRAALTSAFGYRIHPIYGTLRMHKGVDIAVEQGTEIRAPSAGTVRKVKEDSRNGKWLELDHGNGITTVFCHASELKAVKGAKVNAGDVIALSGMTGVATGPHLHYQVHLKSVAVDPLRFRVASAEAVFEAAQLSAAGGAP